MIYQGPDLWAVLKNSEKPIVLWGTGNGADIIIDELNRLGIPVSGIFASNGFVRAREFRGFPVMSYEAAAEKFPEMTVLMCFGSDRAEVLGNADFIASRHPFFAPDVPVAGDNIFNRAFYEAHKPELDSVREHLSDERSRLVFDCVINFKLTGDIKYLRLCESEDDIYTILNLPVGVHYLDLGAFTGDTVAHFAECNPQYRHITAVEPDKRNYRKLQENTLNTADISLIRAVVSDEDGTAFTAGKKGRGTHSDTSGEPVAAVAVDTLLGGEASPIFIKADVEGSELKMLRGAAKTIAEKSPFMVIDCYHRSEDIFTLPLEVLKINPGYRIFMRHRPYIPAWETMFFFVPQPGA